MRVGCPKEIEVKKEGTIMWWLQKIWYSNYLYKFPVILIIILDQFSLTFQKVYDNSMIEFWSLLITQIVARFNTTRWIYYRLFSKNLYIIIKESCLNNRYTILFKSKFWSLWNSYWKFLKWILIQIKSKSNSMISNIL